MAQTRQHRSGVEAEGSEVTTATLQKLEINLKTLLAQQNQKFTETVDEENYNVEQNAKAIGEPKDPSFRCTTTLWEYSGALGSLLKRSPPQEGIQHSPWEPPLWWA